MSLNNISRLLEGWKRYHEAEPCAMDHVYHTMCNKHVYTACVRTRVCTCAWISFTRPIGVWHGTVRHNVDDIYIDYACHSASRVDAAIAAIMAAIVVAAIDSTMVPL